MSISITQGTQTTVNTTLVGGTETQVVRVDMGSGTNASLFSGTVMALQTGTITGTIEAVSSLPANNWGTVINVGTSVLGTIKAAVAGSSIYVTDMTISVGTSSNVVIASGGTSTPIFGTLFLSTNGGAVENFRVPIFTASGSALVYKQSADGPLTITAGGYVK